MFYKVFADLIVVVHFAFVLFVIFGGVLVLWSKRVAWLHIPAVIWGILIEFGGWICPLTPLENLLRQKGGRRLPIGWAFLSTISFLCCIRRS